MLLSLTCSSSFRFSSPFPSHVDIPTHIHYLKHTPRATKTETINNNDKEKQREGYREHETEPRDRDRARVSESFSFSGCACLSRVIPFTHHTGGLSLCLATFPPLLMAVRLPVLAIIPHDRFSLLHSRCTRASRTGLDMMTCVDVIVKTSPLSAPSLCSFSFYSLTPCRDQTCCQWFYSNATLVHRCISTASHALPLSIAHHNDPQIV